MADPQLQAAADLARALADSVGRVIVGKEEVVRLLIVALLADGHVLLEDVPGVGKTTLARAIAASLGGEFRRIQCTPDLLPSDVTGMSVYSPATGTFSFRPGPIMAPVVLVDEVNRATPRTQSALLECMEERQVTVDGVTHRLPRPFFVLATQNPVEYEGTFPLPEAQLDRFLMRLDVGYPTAEQEMAMTRLQQDRHPLADVVPVATLEDVVAAQRAVRRVQVAEEVRAYAVDLVRATRSHPAVRLGASPRGSLGVLRAAQARAAVEGRDFVLPDDVQAVAVPVLAHRLLLTPEASLARTTGVEVVREVLERQPVPVERES